MIDRRRCIVPLLAWAVPVPPAWAKPASRAYRIGWLTPSTVPEPEREFRAAMTRLGYLDGRNVVYDSLSAQDEVGRLPALAAQLVKGKADVIVAVSPFAILPARQATDVIPIVMAFWGGGGLIESGLVRSLARPGGTVTGVSMLPDELEGERLELLLDLAPKARRIGVLWPDQSFDAPDVQRVARASGVVLRVVASGDGSDAYRSTMAELAGERVEALLVPSLPRYFRDARQIINLVASLKLPAIYESPVMADMGGLIAYGPRLEVLESRVASYVDRILKGAKAGDLPIEQPSTFELVVNQTTARAMGIVVPGSLALRADRVIG
ncbi:MAG: ABC transporter substrate-binding protein [Burkholderiaceae bacterium]